MGHQRNRAGQHPPSLTVIGIALVAVLLTAVIGPSGAQAQSAAAADAHLVVRRGGVDDVMVPHNEILGINLDDDESKIVYCCALLIS